MDYKGIITFNLQTLVKKYKKSDRFKASAYSKALSQLPGTPILSYDHVKDVGGDKTKAKLKLIIETNQNLQEVNDYLNDGSFAIIDTLQKIHGVGPAKAQELVNKHNIQSIDDLKQHPELLNNIQKMGLQYFDDIEKKIPFAEMVKHEAFLKKHLEHIQFTIAGSYRRKCAQSSDIDVLVTGDSNRLQEVITKLQDLKYLNTEAVLAHGEVKYMGLCKLPRHKTYRRIDVLFTPPHEYPFALLYFTGNFKFNVDMRKRALSKGYTLNEQGLKISSNYVETETTPRIIPSFTTEEEIFEFLDYPYKKPEDRVV